MKKKLTALILFLLMNVTFFSACTSGNDMSAEPQEDAAQSQSAEEATGSEMENEKPFEGKTVRFIAINHPWQIAAETLFEDFTAQTGIKVEMESMTLEQLTQKSAIELSAQSDTLDVFMYRPQAQKALYDQNGWLLDIDEYVTASPEFNIDDFYQSALDICTADGNLTGIPLTTEKIVMYYRKDLLEAANIPVPTTFEELEEAAALLTDKSNNQFGIVMRGKRGQAITTSSAFIQSMGGTFGPVDGQATFNDPNTIKGYEYYGRLLREYGPPGVVNMGVVEATQLFTQGAAAFYLDSDNERMVIMDPEKSMVHDKVGFATFPAGEDGAKPWNACFWALGISPYSAQPEVAWEFVKYIMSPESAMAIHKLGSPSARSTPWTDQESIDLWPEGWQEVMDETSEIGIGTVLPNVINLEKARDLSDGIIAVAIEGGDVEAAANEANIQYQAIIDEEANAAAG